MLNKAAVTPDAPAAQKGGPQAAADAPERQKSGPQAAGETPRPAAARLEPALQKTPGVPAQAGRAPRPPAAAPGAPAANRCHRCGAPLTADAVGLTRKLINRGATQFMCLPCLAAFFGCDEALLHQKIAQFRRDGCTLFAPGPRRRTDGDD